MQPVPAIRIRAANTAPVRADAAAVVYWMIAARRSRYNFALSRAVEWALDLGRPLVVFEPLRCGYRWASDRLHRFVIEGMRDNAARLRSTRVCYFPYLEPQPGEGSGLLAALAEHAALVVTDDFPAFFLPRMVASAARRLRVRVEQVDSCGLLPLRGADSAFPTAYAFRRYLQRSLPPHLDNFPQADPLEGLELPPRFTLPEPITRRWPPADPATWLAQPHRLSQLPIDHTVAPAPATGGEQAAVQTLRQFLDERLPQYAALRNHPDEDAASGLSPYLHFGHVSAHEMFVELARREAWTAERLGTRAQGRREGWWGMTPPAEAFLDEAITWRELGYNFCAHRHDTDQYASLPAWARQTLAAHAGDPRPHQYTLDEFERAQTHDRLWNAAQSQLVREGRIHNYLRMLWGKKILEWSPKPEDALAIMIELNNKYAVDGRDPNSYSGIFWVLGRYDRPWGPERPIFGKVRYMSSENTARKVRLHNYLSRFAPPPHAA